MGCLGEPRREPRRTMVNTTRAEKIADPDRFDRTREKLKVFQDQLMLKSSGNAARFSNSQQKLRYAYQFLTGKVSHLTY